MTISLGSYPVVTLAMAHDARAEARRLHAQGVDPSEMHKADKRAAAAARTFSEVADEWFETRREPEGKTEAPVKHDRWLTGEWKSAIGTARSAKSNRPNCCPVGDRLRNPSLDDSSGQNEDAA